MSQETHHLERAYEVANILQRALGLDTVENDAKKKQLLPSVAIKVMPCPQQQNGVDCGMYVCLISEWICTSWYPNRTAPTTTHWPTLESFVTPQRIQSIRQNMPKLVEQLRKNVQDRVE
jgi:Ulp1 family protease